MCVGGRREEGGWVRRCGAGGGVENDKCKIMLCEFPFISFFSRYCFRGVLAICFRDLFW